MARPPHLALAVAALAAAVVPLRTLPAFDALSGPVDLLTLTYLSRTAWSLVAVVGFAAAGYAYGEGTGAAPRRVLALAALAAFLGVLAGGLVVRLATDVSRPEPLAMELLLVGAYAGLDAAMFGLLVLGGYALSGRSRG